MLSERRKPKRKNDDRAEKIKNLCLFRSYSYLEVGYLRLNSNIESKSYNNGKFTKVHVLIKICDSMMFNFFNNIVNIFRYYSMIFKKVLFNDFHLMLLSSLLES